MKRIAAAAFVGLGAWSAASAQVKVHEPWVRATVAMQRATGAYMELTAAQDLRLIAARSEVAGVVEIHEMKMDGSVMRMRAVPGLDLPAGRPVQLQPGGYHVMLMDLKQQIRDGDSVPLTLVFEDKNKQRQEVQVKAHARSPATPMQHGPQHPKH